mmetsp:Transcript_9810/g.28829  ORF Transcript_9810/g.28829 Transcript_9810/m.28829 type:complete len:128 (-) Transcript_9810:123-506(-)
MADPLSLGGGATRGFFKEVGLLVLLRQSPFMPFAVSNYYIGAATQLRPGAVALGTLLGCLPTNVLYTFIGASSKALLLSDQFDLSFGSFKDLVPKRAQNAAIAVGFVATVALGFLIMQTMKQAQGDA